MFSRHNFACGVYDDIYIVVAGGKRGEEQMQSARMYNTSTQERIDLSNLPFAGACGGTVHKTCFYVSEYKTGSLYRLCLFTHFDWKDAEWEDVTPSSKKVNSRNAAVVSDGKYLYFINSNKWNNGYTYRYDPETGEVNDLPNLPTPRIDFATAIVGNLIYVIGGYQSSLVEVFNIFTKTWSKAPPICTESESSRIGLQHAAATVINDWIIVCGGVHGDFAPSSDTFMFDTKKQKWTSKCFQSLVMRSNHACVTMGSHIIVIGGNEAIMIPFLIFRVKFPGFK